MMELPIKAELLIPHRGAMCLIDHLVEYKNDSGRVAACFPSDSPFIMDDGVTVDPMALVELVAQSYAAGEGYRDMLAGKKPPEGYLVGISSVSFHKDAHAGDELFIDVRTEESFEKFFIASGKVCMGTENLLEVTLTIYINSENVPEV
jgi:predicted hotdog family 3-hydroxylacyl-ACP dehydratase